MIRCYHISRGTIPESGAFSCHDVLNSNTYATHFNMTPEFRVELYNLYDGRLSEHGIKYVFPSAPITDTHPDRNLYQIEYNFEYYRRKLFPNLTSRFQSYFACSNLDNAREYRQRFFHGVGQIYLIESERVFEADCSHLQVTISMDDNESLAVKYWSGVLSSNPVTELLIAGEVNIIGRAE